MPSVREVSEARYLLWAVTVIAVVACIGLAYTANSVVEAVNEIRFEIRNLNDSCFKARRLTNDSDVLKELPETPSCYFQPCEG